MSTSKKANPVVSKKKATLPAGIRQVWEAVSVVEKYATWRSDLSKTEIIDEKTFVEYAKNGFPTTFTVTLSESCSRLELDIDNGNIKGHWVGIFSSNGNQTDIEFTECVTAKKFFLKPFIKAYLKRQQSRYIADLMIKLSKGYNRIATPK